MKFIHCADLHLDQPFQGLGTLSQSFSNKLSQVNKQMFQSLVETAIVEAVDFVLIVGDTFHQAKPSIQTQQVFISGLEKLNQAGIPVFLTFGNHDYFQAEKYWFDFPENTYCFKHDAVSNKSLTLKTGETVTISGFSYETPHISENKTSEFPVRDRSSQWQIGLYHGQLGRMGEHPYAPFQLGDLQQLNYDYWALGHIHQPQLLAKEPLIIYPGSPVGHTKKETTSRGCVIVESHGSQLSESWVELTDLVWESIVIDGQSADSLAELLAVTEHKLREFAKEQELLTCLAVRFENISSELASLVNQEIAVGELLLYLREFVAQESSHNVWLYQVIEVITHKPMQWPVGMTTESILNQVKVYDDQEKLLVQLTDLFKQSELHQLFANNQEFQEEVIAKTINQLGLTEE